MEMKSDTIYEDCVDFLVGEELKDANENLYYL